MVKEAPLLSYIEAVIKYLSPIYIFSGNFSNLNKILKTQKKTHPCKILSNGTMHKCVLEVPPLTSKHGTFFKNLRYCAQGTFGDFLWIFWHCTWLFLSIPLSHLHRKVALPFRKTKDEVGENFRHFDLHPI